MEFSNSISVLKRPVHNDAQLFNSYCIAHGYDIKYSDKFSDYKGNEWKVVGFKPRSTKYKIVINNGRDTHMATIGWILANKK